MRSRKTGSYCCHDGSSGRFKYRGRVITRRHPLYTRADRRASRREPAHAIDEAMRSLAVETTQRRAARHGVPRPAADAGPSWPDRVAAGELRAANPLANSAPAGAGADRHDTASKTGCGTYSRWSSSRCGAPPEEPLFNSLMEEHHYLGYEQPVGEHLKYLVWAQGRPVACLAWSLGAAAPGQSRPLHRMERRSASTQHPLHRLQHALPDSAVGPGGAFGVAHSGPHGGADLRRLAADVRASDLLSGDLRGSGTIPWNLLPRGQLGPAR